MSGYSNKPLRLLVLIMPKMSGYVKIFKIKDEDKHKNHKLMPSCIDDERLLEKYYFEVIWAMIEDFKNIKLNILRIYDDRYITFAA